MTSPTKKRKGELAADAAPGGRKCSYSLVNNFKKGFHMIKRVTPQGLKQLGQLTSAKNCKAPCRSASPYMVHSGSAANRTHPQIRCVVRGEALEIAKGIVSQLNEGAMTEAAALEALLKYKSGSVPCPSPRQGAEVGTGRCEGGSQATSCR
jgi:hypothetical protein